MAMNPHKVLRTSYIGMRLYEPGEIVMHEEKGAGDNLKKLSAAEIEKYEAKVAAEKPDEDLDFFPY
jgi:hypothetical protein